MAFTSYFAALLIIAAVTRGQPGPPGGLTPREIIETVRHGGVLTYDVDVAKCTANMPPTLPTYSFGDVLSDVYVEVGGENEWRLYSAVERPTNGSRFQLNNAVWRTTELEFEVASQEDGVALITITDIQGGGSSKVLANGTISCKLSSGGFRMNAQRRGGGEIEQQAEAIDAFNRGEMLTFAVDVSMCSKQSEDGQQYSPPPHRGLGAAEYWLSTVNGYRIPGQVANAIEFTSILRGAGQTEVFNVRLLTENKVEVKTYALTRSSEPTTVVTYMCTLGAQGSFHMYRM